MKTSKLLQEHLPDPSLMQRIASQYQLDPEGTHGLSHWGRVLENGLRLSRKTGGDPIVISLFAVFHDACRQNQSVDPGHGQRGARLAADFLDHSSLVTPAQLSQLIIACQLHTDGQTQAEMTVQCCWDADRLDLARAGITPSEKFLCTAEAKSSTIIEWATERSLQDFTPQFVIDLWGPLFSQLTSSEK